MMNAADDDQPSPLLLPAGNTNSLISETFNLNSGSIQPITILPTSSNSSSKTHSRTPSFEPKQVGLSNSQSPSPSQQTSMLNQALKQPPPTNTSSLFNQSPLQPPQSFSTAPPKNLSSFFDQSNSNATTQFVLQQSPLQQPPSSQPTPTPPPQSASTNESNSTKSLLLNQNLSQQSPILFAPIATKPTSTIGNVGIMPPMVNIASTTIAPPLSIPPLQLQPTIPPPPISSSVTSSTSSNPYAAKGALNKKVYDHTGVSVVPVSGSIPPPTINPISAEPDLNNPSAGLFMPPPTLQSSNFVQPNISMESQGQQQQYPMGQMPYSNSLNELQINNNMIGQPIINLNDRISTSLSFGGGGEDNRNMGGARQPNKMWNWFGNVVEKAKHGVESIVTTVDPQMKDFIHPANRPIYLVSSIANNKLVHSIREAFIDAGFSKISQNAYDAQNSSQFAAQIVGFPCAMQSAKQKLDSCLQMVSNAECIVFSFQDFIVELSPDFWFEMAVVMLKDRTNNIELSIFTEATPISNAEISEIQQTTPGDYPFRWSGFAYKLRSHYSNLSSVLVSNQSNPYASNDGLESMISSTRMAHALKTLALLYKNKLIEMLR